MKLKRKFRKSKTQNKVSRRFIQYNNPTDEYVYHITTPHHWNLIKQSKGLVGGLKKQTILGRKLGTEEGFLYVVDSTEKEDFDGLSWSLGFPTDPYLHDYIPHTQHYVILGIRKDWLTKQGLVMEQDEYHSKNSIQYSFGSTENHKQIFLGDRKIPLDQIRWFGNHRFTDPVEMDRRMFRHCSTILNTPIENLLLTFTFYDGKKKTPIILDYGSCHHFNLFHRTMVGGRGLSNNVGKVFLKDDIKDPDEYKDLEDHLTRLRSIKKPLTKELERKKVRF